MNSYGNEKLKSRLFISIFAIIIGTITTIIGYQYAITNNISFLLILPAIFVCIGCLFLQFKKETFSIFLIISSSFLVMIEPAPTDVFAITAICVFIFKSVLHKKQIIEKSFIEGMFFLYLVFSVQNVFYTQDVDYSIRYYLITTFLVALSFYISRITTTYDLIQYHIKLFLIPCTITSILLILTNIFLTFDISIGYFSDLLISEGRASALFKDPNVAAPFLLIGINYLTASILIEKTKNKLFSLSCLFILVLGAISSYSRAALIGVMSSILFIALSISKKSLIKNLSILTFILIGFICVIMIMPETNLSTRLFDTEFGVSERMNRINYGLDIISANVMSGKGMDYDLYKAPHDSYFLVLTESGIFGFILLWLPISVILIRLIRVSQSLMETNKKMIFIILGSTLFSHIIIGCVIYILHWRHFWYLVGLSCAAIQILKNDDNLNLISTVK